MVATTVVPTLNSKGEWLKHNPYISIYSYDSLTTLITIIVYFSNLKNDNWDLWCYKGLYMSKKLLVLEFIEFMLSYQHLYRAIVLLLKYIKCYRKRANFEWYRRYVDYLGLFCKYDFFQMQEQQLVSLNFGRESTSFWGDLAAGICSQFYKIYLPR